MRGSAPSSPQLSLTLLHNRQHKLPTVIVLARLSLSRFSCVLCLSPVSYLAHLEGYLQRNQNNPLRREGVPEMIGRVKLQFVAGEPFTIHGIDFDKAHKGHFVRVQQGEHFLSVPEELLRSTEAYGEWRRKLARRVQELQSQQSKEKPTLIE